MSLVIRKFWTTIWRTVFDALLVGVPAGFEVALDLDPVTLAGAEGETLPVDAVVPDERDVLVAAGAILKGGSGPSGGVQVFSSASSAIGEKR
ncbi:MAG TPA: hypothetical protein VIA62_20050 [Thermoanaerobaculia bacterium]|nr:hypothetical protein [Thermoanaerobaculia bacterium]